MLRRILLCGLVAGAVGLPSAAWAVKANGNAEGAQPHRSVPLQPKPAFGNAHGAGVYNGADPGHVVGPGTAPIDNESRGPINDVVPGAGTADTPQSKNPRPVP